MSKLSLDVALTIGVAASFVAGAIGAGVAWWIRRRTTLTIRNLYVLALILAALFGAAVALHALSALLVLGPLLVFAASASLIGRRWRLSDLGAGEELRRYEQHRRWVWQPRPRRQGGERIYIATQGEIVHERPWPPSEPHVPMTRDDAARLPRRAGQHVASFGATGSGKTTSVLRRAEHRVLPASQCRAAQPRQVDLPLAVAPRGAPRTALMLLLARRRMLGPRDRARL